MVLGNVELVITSGLRSHVMYGRSCAVNLMNTILGLWTINTETRGRGHQGGGLILG